MSEAPLNGARLETLRRIHGLTQRDLGARLSIHPSQLSRIESGEKPLVSSLAHAASSAFGEPLSFFTVSNNPVHLGPPAFRRRAAATAQEQARIQELFREAARVFFLVSQASGYHAAALPVVIDSSDPERLAEDLRRETGIGRTAPIANLVRTLERLGVGVVTDLDEAHEADRRDISGIAMPTVQNERPIVATPMIGRGDVQRMTLAHELGHLIFDGRAATISCSTRSPQEKRAFAFGSAFLLPRTVVEDRITDASTLRDYLEVKADYGISAKAVMYRAMRLGLISEARHRTLSIQHSSRGWTQEEPVAVAVESPLLVSQALTRVYPTATFARASHELGVAPERLRRWTGRLESDEAHTAPVTVLRQR
ncbi:ImmA/IrrE family metallo-endopeptidase [Rathayibacter sp. AY1A4]|uniref:helix-turn-helix domain-containing protein n=1 Tax=Rathayibacter sp. AY1A4 TaxID=2080522 RepID=UPI0015E1FBA1|nr:XRE family transcriptional regulator [Rathayibacter sp. AY1A4]